MNFFNKIFEQHLFESKNKNKESQIPEEKREKFDKLVDLYMDKHNMSGDAARKKALEELNLSEGSLGYKRSLRAAKHGGQTLLNAVRKFAYKRGMENFNIRDYIDAEKEYGPIPGSEKDKADMRGRKKNLDMKLFKLINTAYPPGDEKLGHHRKRKRKELKDIANRTSQKAEDLASAERIYLDQPMADRKEKDLFLKIMHRRKDLGLL